LGQTSCGRGHDLPKGGAKRRHSRAAAAALPAEAVTGLLQLQPPLIQGQSVGLRLTIELVPSTSWGDNMRAVVSRRTWDQIRMAAYRASGYRCAICGGHGQLSCHERWAYDDQTATQTLLGFLALCTMCHWVKHIGRAGQLARAGQLDYEAVVQHFMAVNDCTYKTFEEHRTQAFDVWRRRSAHPWMVDLGPYAAMVTAKAKGESR
jgi:hypothetical protein